MGKIILAINELKLNEQTINFACVVANLSQSELIGIFLEDPDRDKIHVQDQLYIVEPMGILSPDAKEEHTRQSIETFKDACEAQKVKCSVHVDNGIPADELIAESRFADILILEAGISFELDNESDPAKFVKEMLASAECPVIVAPDKFADIDELLFTYDGGKASVFAMKQFTYLFPGLRNKKVSVIEVNEDNESNIPEKDKLQEWLRSYYETVDFIAATGFAQERLLEYLSGKDRILVVMGAFSRSTISNMIKPSTAIPLIESMSQPLFIAHP
jgi:hypothetical protein